MYMINENKIKRSIKIYPIFYGLTSDLIFWFAINTLFLTTVKHLTPAQINSIEATATGVGILIQLFAIQIIRKIGNTNAVKLGTILLFFSALLNTICKTYWGLLIAEMCYTVGFIFKVMDDVMLMNNLEYMHEREKFIKLQTTGNTIYSLATLIISLISGFIFSINPYIPMYICITICFINVIMSFYLYEAPITKAEEKKEKHVLNINKLVVLIITLYGLFYTMISVGQKNAKLFIQLNMQDFLTISKVSIYLGIIIFISRIFRLLSNILFLKIYDKIKKNLLYHFETLLVLSFTLILTGDFIGRNVTGIILMSLGFFIILSIRDPFTTYMHKLVFDNTEKEIHDKMIIYLSLTNKIFALFYGMAISALLISYNYTNVMCLLLLITLLFIIPIVKVNKQIKKTA